MKKYLILATILCTFISACRPGTESKPATSTIHPVLNTSTPMPSAPAVSIVGEPEVVYSWEADRCANDMLPDLPTRAIRNADGMVQLIISSSKNYRLIGADFDSLVPDCSPVMVSDEDRNPANYDHSEWLAALYTEDGRTIHAIVHNEYHGDQAGSIWQAALDFSQKQGTQGWTYQSWDGSTSTNMTYDASRNEWVGSGPLCLIAPWGMHPDLNCVPSLTWTSPITGTVTLSGNVRDLDSTGGDGVVAQILEGDVELWSATIDNGDESAHSFALKVEVQEGDQIQFRVNSRGDAGLDATFFDPGINLGPAPCPSNRHDLCTLISLTYAFSTDGGKTYLQASTPDHRLANFPAPYDPEWMRAIWQPSSIVKHPQDGHYYALIQYDEHNADYSSNTQGMCLIRTRTPGEPAGWRAWDGNGFNLHFINPYVETDANPQDHTCELVTPKTAHFPMV